MILGIDVSTFLEQQRIAHSKYKKNGQEIDPFLIFKQNGVTHIRTRIWNDPYGENKEPYLAGTCDIDNFIALAKYLRPYGFKHIVDFHYSDFWADPAKQFLPKAWEKLTFYELVDAVYDFTFESLTKIKEEGIEVDMVQVGNEITHGFLWPLGKILDGSEKEESYNRFATLLKSGIKAVYDVFKNAKTIIHLEQSYDQNLYKEILTNLKNRGVRFDILGTSYYPFWHHSFDEYFANVDMVKREFNIPVMNVEVGFPFTLTDYRVDDDNKPKHLVINADNIEDYLKLLPFYPDENGQEKFIEKFIDLGKKHHLCGICYWEPLWIPGDGICWASKKAQEYQHDTSKDTRNEWANQCLFDYEGCALPALDKYKI